MSKVIELSTFQCKAIAGFMVEAIGACSGENVTPETIGKIAARLALSHGTESNFGTAVGQAACLIQNIPRPSNPVEARALSSMLGGIFGLGDVFQYAGKSATRVQLFEARDDGIPNTNATKNFLPYHCDVAVMPPALRAHAIGLLPVVNESDTATLVAPLEEMLACVPVAIVRYAMTDAFEVKAPESLGLGNDAWFVRPLIQEFNGELTIGFPTYGVRPRRADDWDAITAIRALTASAQQCSKEVVIEPGSFLCVSNLLAMHGRGVTVGYRKVYRSYFSRCIGVLREAQPDAQNDVFDAVRLVPPPTSVALRVAA